MWKTNTYSSTELIKDFSKFNVNFIQGEIILACSEYYLNFVSDEYVNELIDFCINNKIYNGVPRLCQGNEVKDIGPSIKKDFDNIMRKLDLPIYLYNTIYFTLLGDFEKAKQNFNRF